MHKLLNSELSANGARYAEIGFGEQCAIVNTKLYDTQRADKSVKIFVRPGSKDTWVYVLPLVEKKGNVGLSAETKLIVYTNHFPRIISDTFEITKKYELAFLMSHTVKASSYKEDMAEFIKRLGDKYPWHLF